MHPFRVAGTSLAEQQSLAACSRTPRAAASASSRSRRCPPAASPWTGPRKSPDPVTMLSAGGPVGGDVLAGPWRPGSVGRSASGTSPWSNASLRRARPAGRGRPPGRARPAGRGRPSDRALGEHYPYWGRDSARSWPRTRAVSGLWAGTCSRRTPCVGDGREKGTPHLGRRPRGPGLSYGLRTPGTRRPSCSPRIGWVRARLGDVP